MSFANCHQCHYWKYPSKEWSWQRQWCWSPNVTSSILVICIIAECYICFVTVSLLPMIISPSHPSASLSLPPQMTHYQGNNAHWINYNIFMAGGKSQLDNVQKVDNVGSNIDVFRMSEYQTCQFDDIIFFSFVLSICVADNICLFSNIVCCTWNWMWIRKDSLQCKMDVAITIVVWEPVSLINQMKYFTYSLHVE